MEEQKAGYGLKAALTENFIQDASSILKKMEMEAERVKKVQQALTNSRGVKIYRKEVEKFGWSGNGI